MSAPSYRAQVILDKRDLERLQYLAEKHGRTLSETIREAVTRYLEACEQQELQEFLSAMAELRQIREKNVAQYGVYEGDPIGEAREERERQMEDV